MAADDRLDEHLEEDDLARRLRDAHRRVRLLTPAQQRRFLAICDLAKRDPDRAGTRLDAFLADLPDTPRSQENALGD
ncbi:hypothetical protein ACIBH1_16515 [Nonomuraea sp. NPDC050663]|uniref:hypothetical protein n=1 Tax=Nonomuraea sp. NPDC050663 TaxID=3364370 RepID=UPI0037AA29FF